MSHEEIKKIIEDFLNKLTVDFNEIEIIENEVHPTLLIKTGDSGVLIGEGGENLKALNHLVKKVVEKRFNAKNREDRLQFLLDVNDYHGKKIETLKNQAKILAERARMFKSDVEMSPMNAYERMIIHSTFADDKEIETQSEGEGKTRRVVLKYRN
ncbi:MAG: protein jag [Candidatus Paceibacteria bacterium]